MSEPDFVPLHLVDVDTFHWLSEILITNVIMLHPLGTMVTTFHGNPSAFDGFGHVAKNSQLYSFKPRGVAQWTKQRKCLSNCYMIIKLQAQLSLFPFFNYFYSVFVLQMLPRPE